MRPNLSHLASAPAAGSVAPGYETLARVFASQFERGDQIGASLAVFHRGRLVVDLWGGLSDRRSGKPWARDTRIVVFSVSKGLASMGLHLLSDRGLLDWDAPVTQYWPEFGQGGKEGVSVRTLLNHRAGLPALDEPITVEDITDPARASFLGDVIARQRPAWEPGTDQGYHALTFGLYLQEIFERVAGEPLGPFLTRELFEPLGSDARLGTPERFDPDFAELYCDPFYARLARLVGTWLAHPTAPEAHIFRAYTRRDSLTIRTFDNPKGGPRKVLVFNDIPMRRSAFASAAGTASAQGLARAYLPFANGGEHDGRRFFSKESLTPLHRRQSWSTMDRVMHKSIGWSQGFLKEERHLFSPHPESFGHAGMGGALGWCDPVNQLTIGYVMNKMDWRVRSKRTVELCRALYECEALLETS